MMTRHSGLGARVLLVAPWWIAAALASVAGCAGDDVEPDPDGNPPPFTAGVYDAGILSEETEYGAEDLQRVQQAYLFFGHQSVGTNILDGLTSLQGDEPAYTVTQRYLYNDFRAFAGAPALGHRNLGTNTQPQTKIQAFDDIMRASDPPGNHLGNQVRIGMVKFCFVDVDTGTDVEALFDSYRATMQALEHDFPQTIFVYTTVPIGLGSAADVQRNAYNDLVRTYCRDTSRPLFDIAAVEAVAHNGQRCTFAAGGSTYDRLCQEYSAGDPHLNESGGRRLAKVMMLMFADLLRL